MITKNPMSTITELYLEVTDVNKNPRLNRAANYYSEFIPIGTDNEGTYVVRNHTLKFYCVLVGIPYLEFGE